MRILLSVPWFFPERGGGGQTYVQQVASELAKRGHEPLVLTAQPWEGGQGDWKLGQYEHLGVRVLAFQLDPLSVRWEETIAERGPSIRAALSAALKEAKPEVVHFNGFKAQLAELCLEQELPFVVTAHHPGVVCPAGARLNEKGEICREVARPEVCVRCCCIQRAGSRLLGTSLAALPAELSRLAMRASSNRGPGGKVLRAVAYPEAVRDSLRSKALVWEKAPLWIAPSQAMMGCLLRQGIGEGRVVHIPHGIEPVAGVPPVRLEGGRVRFGYLGGFSFVKGLHVLIEAAQSMTHGDHCEIHVFGKASSPWGCAYRNQTVGRYSGKAKLVVHDPIPHERIAEAYAAFDVLVVPSICPEVFGLVVMEAFTAGRPVIVSNAGALPELVRDGVDGLVVPHNNGAALSLALATLAGNPGLVVRMAEQVQPQHGIETHVQALQAAYSAVAAGHWVGRG